MLMSLLQTFSFWHWLILGVLLFILEILAPGVAFLWIGVAALVTGAMTWLIPDLSIPLQVIFFAIVAIVCVIAGRTWVKRISVETDQPGLNRRGEQYIGKSFTLSEPISGGFGKIKMHDTIWTIAGADMETGAHIEVTDVDGAVLMVEKRD